jgi:hypothetical protein
MGFSWASSSSAPDHVRGGRRRREYPCVLADAEIDLLLAGGEPMDAA